VREGKKKTQRSIERIGGVGGEASLLGVRRVEAPPKKGKKVGGKRGQECVKNLLPHGRARGACRKKRDRPNKERGEEKRGSEGQQDGLVFGNLLTPQDLDSEKRVIYQREEHLIPAEMVIVRRLLRV